MYPRFLSTKGHNLCSAVTHDSNGEEMRRMVSCASYQWKGYGIQSVISWSFSAVSLCRTAHSFEVFVFCDIGLSTVREYSSRIDLLIFYRHLRFTKTPLIYMSSLSFRTTIFFHSHCHISPSIRKTIELCTTALRPYWKSLWIQDVSRIVDRPNLSHLPMITWWVSSRFSSQRTYGGIRSSSAVPKLRLIWNLLDMIYLSGNFIVTCVVEQRGHHGWIMRQSLSRFVLHYWAHYISHAWIRCIVATSEAQCLEHTSILDWWKDLMQMWRISTDKPRRRGQNKGAHFIIWHKVMKNVIERLNQTGQVRLPGWNSRNLLIEGFDTLRDMTKSQSLAFLEFKPFLSGRPFNSYLLFVHSLVFRLFRYRTISTCDHWP